MNVRIGVSGRIILYTILGPFLQLNLDLATFQDINEKLFKLEYPPYIFLHFA